MIFHSTSRVEMFDINKPSRIRIKSIPFVERSSAKIDRPRGIDHSDASSQRVSRDKNAPSHVSHTRHRRFEVRGCTYVG